MLPTIIPIVQVGKLRLVEIKQFAYRQVAQPPLNPISAQLQNLSSAPGGLKNWLGWGDKVTFMCLTVGLLWVWGGVDVPKDMDWTSAETSQLGLWSQDAPSTLAPIQGAERSEGIGVTTISLEVSRTWCEVHIFRKPNQGASSEIQNPPILAYTVWILTRMSHLKGCLWAISPHTHHTDWKTETWITVRTSLR